MPRQSKRGESCKESVEEERLHWHTWVGGTKERSQGKKVSGVTVEAFSRVSGIVQEESQNEISFLFLVFFDKIRDFSAIS